MTTDLQREARLVGLAEKSAPTLSAVERRRSQLQIVVFFVMGALGLAVALLSAAGDAVTEGLLQLPAFRIASPILTAGLALYVVEKERHLNRLTRMLLEDHAVMTDLARQARRDPLTRLANRVALMEDLERAVESARAGNRDDDGRFALVFIDLDGFKHVNDTRGHAAGDWLLVEVARRLKTVSRESDTVARLSGDEFVILLEGVEDAVAYSVAERVNAALEDLAFPDGATVSVTASIGVSFGDASTTSAATVLREADMAMYLAKETGRARWAPFDPSLLRWAE